MTIDHNYDDSENTRPDGVIYVVTGAGGQLVSWDNKPECSDFTRRQVIDRHSFSLLDFSPGKLVFRQIDDEGKELDCFTLSRAGSSQAECSSKSA